MPGTEAEEVSPRALREAESGSYKSQGQIAPRKDRHSGQWAGDAGGDGEEGWERKKTGVCGYRTPLLYQVSCYVVETPVEKDMAL